ncbi:MAG: hypothetical protein OXK21_04175 [Chloroflexota bacterium]|nr:hypothetical protein [Chloroflexota bacterium]
MTATASYAHLVGSVPLADTESVFRAVCAELGPHLRRIPDGETGERLRWTEFQRDMLRNHPDMEIDPDIHARSLNQAERVMLGMRPWLRLKPSADPDALRFPTGYADVAVASYAEYSRLQDEGVIPAATRFLVALPTPLAPAYQFVSPASRDAFMPAYERALLEALDGICGAIPHERLSIQWDICLEVMLFAGYFSQRPDDYKAPVFDMLARLGDRVPEAVEMGYHICYGMPPGAPFANPEDMGQMVELSNGAIERLARQLDFIHIPAANDRDAGAFFQPLRDLALPEGTELILGLIHPDDADGDAERIAEARQYAPVFSVATECGWGREDPAQVPGLLASHRRAVETLNRRD